MPTQIPESDLAILDAATALFAEVLRTLPPAEAQSEASLGGTKEEALPDWSQRECANHVLGGGLRYAAYFVTARAAAPQSGTPTTAHSNSDTSTSAPSAPDIEWTRTADHAGTDPLAALERTSAPLRQEFVAAPNAEALVPHRLADISISDLLGLRVLELTLHAWDMNPTCWERPIPGVSYEVEELAAWLLDRALPILETMRTFGVFDDPVSVRSEVPVNARTQLLGLSGRHLTEPPSAITPERS